MSDLTDGLAKQAYEIEDELKIRKQLEAHTGWQFEFRKHEKYQYDLSIMKWADTPTDCDDNEVLGYVELERSRGDKECSWISGDIPDSWVFISFLKRKVNQFDTKTDTWGVVKENYGETVYLKFNHKMDNCFAAPIEAIYEDGETTPRSDGTRNNTYLSLEIDHPEIRYGINDCVSFIESYLTEDETKQQMTVLDY
jgi:hypothetical protein